MWALSSSSLSPSTGLSSPTAVSATPECQANCCHGETSWPRRRRVTTART